KFPLSIVSKPLNSAKLKVSVAEFYDENPLERNISVFESNSSDLTQYIFPIKSNLITSKTFSTDNVELDITEHIQAKLTSSASQVILMLEGSFMDLYNSLGNDNTKWPVLELVYGDAVAPVITPSASNILFVNKAAAGNGTGNSWANAIPELADALKWARENKDAGLWSS